ncbi:Glutamate decarboxylase 1 [Chlorella vulgaris]
MPLPMHGMKPAVVPPTALSASLMLPALSRRTHHSRCRPANHVPVQRKAPVLRMAATLRADSPTHHGETALFDWLVQQCATPACPKVERRYVSDDVGYCLVATKEVAPDEVILSVPLTAAITSEGVDESRWSTHMAIELLERQSGSCQPWLDALPVHVDLPWLYWSDAELAELQEEDTIAEAGQLRAVFESACQELEGRFARQQVAWALSLVHSRSFVMKGCHVWLPGIDMCNHTLANNAGIRCVRSPGSCQGASAVEEVCPPQAAAVGSQEPDRFELVAEERGIAAGEEVTISYGSWPSDVFLLFFGFVPASNPHDSAVLFYDLFDLSSFQQRMAATAAGIDARLLDAAQALLLAGRGSTSGQPMSLPAFLRLRCQELLDSYPTSLQEDQVLLQQLEQQAAAGDGSAALPSGTVRLPQLTAAVRYRLGKKQNLSVVAGMRPAEVREIACDTGTPTQFITNTMSFIKNAAEAVKRDVADLTAKMKKLGKEEEEMSANLVGHLAERIPNLSPEMADPDNAVDDLLDSTFASRYTSTPMSKTTMPLHGAPAHVVYQLITDVRKLDATPALNLASFVTTWMEPEAEKLIHESLAVNYVDTVEYPSSTEIHNRCVTMLAKLWHSPSVPDEGPVDAVGTGCIGSSEAIMLGALSLKKKWEAKRKAEGKEATKPNLVMGAQVHVCWQKFCRYFDVEERYVPAEVGRYVATPELIRDLCDENTIGVAVVFGSTYNGEFEDVEGIDKVLSELNAKHDWGLSIHIDGASGAFVAPFLYPDLKWDFRLDNVASINASGHKYGLVYPGLGWIIWRDATHLPEAMVFWEAYLGTMERSITLNFSKPATNIIAQYYVFLRLGYSGYRKIMMNLDIIRKRLVNALSRTGHFEILSKDIGVPLVAFRLKTVTGSDGKEHHRLYDEFALSDRLRMRGWVLPAYSMPDNAGDVKLMRVTIREDFSIGMADMLVADIEDALKWLDTHFTFSREDINKIAQAQLGRRLSRFDSSILARPPQDDDKQVDVKARRWCWRAIKAADQAIMAKLRAHGATMDLDPRTRFLYVPHTVTFLFLGMLALVYFSHPFHPPQRPVEPTAAAAVAYNNSKVGVWAMVLVYLGYSVVQGPSTRMVRPHPAVWRLVHGIMVCYLLFMTYLLFQNVHDARQFLKHLYPELGVELPEKHYGTNCALYIPGKGVNWQVLHDTIFDEFVVAHTVGWWAKALIIRNYTMLWFISIAFELCEKTLQHWLPNFNECWWDSWVLDVAICNAIGIYTGMWTVRYFKSKQYNWSGISEQPSLLAMAKRSLLQFTPHSWDHFDWQIFSSPKRCVQCFFPVGIILLFEVNHFFLKFVLWVPPSNPLNTYRLIILALFALPGIKEYYEFLESDAKNIFTKLGTFAWLAMAIAVVETLICIKFSKGLFPQPWPTHVLWAWGIASVVFTVTFGTWCWRFYVLGKRLAGGRSVSARQKTQ